LKEKKDELGSGKIFARLPKFSNGDGYTRLFMETPGIEIDGKMIPVLDGSTAIELQNKKLEFTSSTEKLVIDVPKMNMTVKELAWVYVPQPRYKPGSIIKGFIVARERLNPYVMAMRKSSSSSGQVRLVRDNGDVIVAIPVDLTGIVTGFEIDLSEKIFMKTGHFSIDVLNDDGSVIGNTKVEIVHFEKKELLLSVDAPSWIFEGDDVEITVKGTYFHGDAVKNALVSIERKDSGQVIEIKRLEGKDHATFKVSRDNISPDKIGKDRCQFFEAKMIDDQGREDSAVVMVIVSDVIASFKVMLPEETVFSTLPMKATVKLESPDGLSIPFTPVQATWKRIGRMSTEKIERKVMKTDVNGCIEVEETFDHDGSYEFTVETEIKGNNVSATKMVPVKRFTQGDVFLRNKLEQKTCIEGSKIKGKIKVHAAPETTGKITSGYVDLITDKIVESRRIEIKDGEAEYEFNGVLDFWGTAAVDFYINAIKSSIEISDISRIDKAGCIHSKEKIVIKPRIPIELKAVIESPGTTPTGKEIGISVSVDSELLKEEIHVFGAIVDKRVAVNHDGDIKKTFLKSPPSLEVNVLESKRKFRVTMQSQMGGRPRGGYVSSTFRSSSLPPPPSSAKWIMSKSASSGEQPRYLVRSRSTRARQKTSWSNDIIYSCSAMDNGPDSFTALSPEDLEDAMNSIDINDDFTEIIRENFAESVIIAPVHLENNRATMKIKMPDSVTTYDIILFVVAESQFGMVKKSIVVKNSVFTQLLNPAEMVLESDEVNIRAVVQNTTNEEIMDAELLLHGLENVMLEGTGTRILDPIPPSGASFADWKITGSKVGEVNLLLDLRTRNLFERSCIDQSLFIKPPGTPVTTTTRSFIVEGSPVMIPWNVSGDEAFVLGRINVLPSMEIANIEGMESLARYPHGCMEQTVSSTAPNLVVMKYLEAAEKLPGSVKENLVANMQSGFERMMEYHNDDGGFSYWGGNSSPFYTALGISLIARMKPYINGIPSDLFDKALKYLEKSKTGEHWNSIDCRGHSISPRTVTPHAITAYVVNALAIAGLRDDDAFQWLGDHVNEYAGDPTTIAMVLESLALANGYRDGELKERLVGLLDGLEIRENGTVHWPRGSAMTSDVESTARVMIACNALMERDTGMYSRLHDTLSKSAEYLLSKRKGTGWGSTSDTYHAAMAISSIASGSKPDFSLTLEVNGKTIKEEKITPDNIGWKVHDLREIFVDDLNDGQNEVFIFMKGSGKCHVVAELDKYYHDSGPDDEKVAIVNASLSSDEVTVGSKVEMIVEVEPIKGPMESVMVTIPVPSLLHFNEGCVKIMDDFLDHVIWDKKRNTVNVFHRHIGEKKRMRIPFEAKFKGKARVDGKVFEMYSGTEIPVQPMTIVVN
jgi:hypothetical protein